MNSRSQTHTLTSRHQGAWALLLVLALLWAQTLGLAHRVWHVPGQLAPELSQVSQVRFALSPGAVRTGLLDHFQSGAQGDPSCQMLDQLGLGESLTACPILALPTVLFASILVVWVGIGSPSELATFEARGPPGV
jgi:hypothetical protein